jgi:hypothetical protein
MATSPLKAIADYFGYESLSTFASDYQKLDEVERAQIREGIESGTLTY